jgi:hypothetical protein
MKHSQVDYSILSNDNIINIKLKLFTPEVFTFEDDIELTVLFELSKTLDKPIPEILLTEILRELEELNAHVSYEAETKLRADTEEWFSSMEFETDLS